MKILSRTCTVAGCTALLIALTSVTAANTAGVTAPAKGTLLVDGAGVSFSITLDREEPDVLSSGLRVQWC